MRVIIYIFIFIQATQHIGSERNFSAEHRCIRSDCEYRHEFMNGFAGNQQLL